MIDAMTARDHVFAPDTPPMPCVSGMALLDMLRTLQELVGPQAYGQAIESLPEAMQRELNAATAVSWVDMLTLSSVLEGCAAASGREPEALVDETVRRSIERTFKTVWRLLLRVTTIDAMLKRAPIIYARSRNVGQLTVEMLSPQHAQLNLTGWPDVSQRQLRVLAVSIQTVSALSGRRDVQIHFARTAEGGRFQVRFEH